MLGPMDLVIIAIYSFTLSLALSIVIHRVGARMGIVGRDVHKSWESYAVRIGGLSLLSAVIAIYTVDHSMASITILAVTVASGLIGLIDDLRTLPAIEKVALSAIPGIIHLVLGVYEPRLYIPLLGEISARILYIFLIPTAYMVALNAANMMDTHNGLLAGSIMVSIAVLAPIMIHRSIDPEAMSYIIASIEGSIAGLLILNTYPARVFVGNSGSFIIGSWIAYLALYSRSEFLVILSLFPMIINGFSIITSIGGIKEKSMIKTRPVVVDKGMIKANRDPRAPITIAHIASATTKKGIREIELVIATWILFYIASIAAAIIYTIMTPYT